MTSRNAGSVRTRTVGSALYNMCVQTSNILASNVSDSKWCFEAIRFYIMSRKHEQYGMALTHDGVQIYRDKDKPLYRKGNKVLLAFTAYNIILIILSKLYYKWRNATRDRIWESMSAADKAYYLEHTTDKGNKRCESTLNPRSNSLKC